MKNFGTYFVEQVTVGLTEYIEINGLGQVKAKIDSGNQGYNVLHGINITPIDENKIKFLTINNKTVSFEKRGFIKINIGQQEEMRPVISLNFKLGNQFYENIPFSVTDRSKNDEPVLIGEPFLKKINAIIDVNKEQLQESPLISTRFTSTDEQITVLEKQKIILQKKIENEYKEGKTIQTHDYYSFLHELEGINNKLKELTPVAPEKAVRGFDKLRKFISSNQ